MIGVFLRNAEGDVAFACPAGEEKILSFHYAKALRIMTAETQNRGQEVFTSEIAPELHMALAETSRILVAEIDENGEELCEYWADLTAD